MTTQKQTNKPCRYCGCKSHEAIAEAAEKLSRLLHDMTTENFSKGYDKPEREALNLALSNLATIRKG